MVSTNQKRILHNKKNETPRHNCRDVSSKIKSLAIKWTKKMDGID